MKWGIILFVMYIILNLSILYLNPLKILDNNLDLYILFSIFLGLIFSVITYNTYETTKNYNIGPLLIKVLLFVVSVFSLMLLIFLILYLIIFSQIPLNFIIIILNILILISILSFFYKVFESIIGSDNVNDIVLLIVNVIFYIPCLFIDLIEYLNKLNKNTTPTEWNILYISIILILVRIGIPFLYSLYNKHVKYRHGRLIEKGPIYLNESKNLGILQDYKNDEISKFNYNFALSFWVWINPQPSSTSDAYNKRTILFNYGDILEINYNKNKIEIFAATTKDSITNPNKLIKVYENNDIKYQRWNNFIINYFGGTLDIFLNNKLIVSKINITPILFPNTIIAGSDNGINGGIKNIVYYNKTLTTNEISSIYYE